MRPTDSSQDPAAGFRLAILVEGGLGFLAVALAWLLGVSLREQFSTTASAALRSVGWGIAATLPLLAGFWWLVHAQAPTLRQLRNRVDQLLRELFPRANLMELAVISALAGVTEELLFRGVVQTYLISWTMPILGLAIASLVFGAFHAMSRLYFVLTTAVGVYLGALLLWCQDLTVPIVAHGLYDFLALAYLTRALPTEVRDERSN